MLKVVVKKNVYDCNYISKRQYLSGPFITVALTGFSLYTSYYHTRNWLHPIQSRDFGKIVADGNIFGYGINDGLLSGNDGGNGLKLPVNNDVKDSVRNITNDTIDKLRKRFTFRMSFASLYLRPIMFDKNELKALNSFLDVDKIDEVELMYKYGICHSFWVINAGAVDYYLDFINEGIRFEMVEMKSSNINDMEHFIQYTNSPIHSSIDSHQLVGWISKQLNNEYNLKNNHCLTFSLNFGKEFLPNYFNDISNVKDNSQIINWVKTAVNGV